MSTSEDDAANHVVVGEEGDAFVLGTAGGKGFLNRYGADGTLLWRADVAISDCEACWILELASVQNTLYAFTVDGPKTVGVTAFSLSGEELSRYRADVTGMYIRDAVIGSETESYVLSLGEDAWYLDAFDPQGQRRWMKRVRFPTVSTSLSHSGVSLAPSPDGGIYVAGIGNLHKYRADGTLEWARTLSFNNQAHLWEHLAVGSNNAVYYVRDFAVEGFAPSTNVEIKRFDAEGKELWTRTLVDERVVTTNHLLAVERLAVSPSGVLFLVSWEAYLPRDTPSVYFNALYAVTPDAQVSEGHVLEYDRIYDMAFAPFEEDQGYVGLDIKASYLFTVGSSRETEAYCYDPEDDEVGPSPYCPDADAFVAKYRHLSSSQSYEEGATPAGELVWYRD